MNKPRSTHFMALFTIGCILALAAVVATIPDDMPTAYDMEKLRAEAQRRAQQEVGR